MIMMLFIVQLNQFYKPKLLNTEKFLQVNCMNKEINNALLEMKWTNL